MPYSRRNPTVGFIIASLAVPLLIEWISNDIYDALKQYTYIFALVRYFLYTIMLIYLCFCIRVDDSQVTEPPVSPVAEPTDSPVTGSPVTGHLDIPREVATTENLNHWRKLSLTFRASRRFRYFANTEKAEQLLQRQQFEVAGLTTPSEFNHGGQSKSLSEKSLSVPDTEHKAAVTKPSLELKFTKGLLTAKDPLRFVHGLRPPKDGQSTPASDGNLNVDTLSSLVKTMDTGVLKRHGGIHGIAQQLNVDPKEGLHQWQCKKNRTEYGANSHPEKPPKGLSAFVWEAMHELVLLILCVCALVSFVTEIRFKGIQDGWYDGTVILLRFTVGVLVTAFSGFQYSLQFRNVRKANKILFIHVTRGGARKKVSICDVVVGDIVHLSIGDQIPADGLLIAGCELTVCETYVTGESQPQLKSPEHNPFLLSGTLVQDGSGIMLVSGVGVRTWGVQPLLRVESWDDDSEPMLLVKLHHLAAFIGKLGLLLALLTFLVLVARFMFSKYTAGGIQEWGKEDVVAIVNYFTIAVTIIVMAASEGLPWAVTHTLAFAMKKMMLDKALVRDWRACENMGSATAVCSNKTGTLTTRKMAVVRVWVAGCAGNVREVKSKISPRVRDILIENIFRNTSGYVGDDMDLYGDLDGKPVLIGTPTEAAVLEFGYALGGLPTIEKFQIVKVIPFSSARKRMGVTVRHADGHLRAHWKGASELVLEMCTRTIDAEGNVVSLTGKTRKDLTDAINSFADQGLRTLCLAYSDLLRHQCHQVPETDLVFLAIVGIRNPVHPDVAEAVKLCFSAGVKVRMVTGDNIHTAKAIARECGILTDGVAVEGPEFRRWTDDDERIPDVQVMARSSTEDKLKFVQCLQKRGEVVAVTGYDAPALHHEADIGMAMGICCTEAAKVSADVIVLDNNFSTIVVVAKWGRAIYTNIQKSVQFQLTLILAALVINFTSACIIGEAPLTAVQLLWVNVIPENLGCLALARQPPHDDLLKKGPIRQVIRQRARGNFISNIMWRNVLGQVIYQVMVLDLLKYYGQNILQLEGSESEVDAQLNTIIFNAFAFCQVFNLINALEMEKMNVFAHISNDNRMFFAVIIFTAIFQWIMVSFLGKLANTVPLTGNQWLITVGIGAVSMLVAVLVKFIPVPTEELPTPQTNGYEPLPGGPPEKDWV